MVRLSGDRSSAAVLGKGRRGWREALRRPIELGPTQVESSAAGRGATNQSCAGKGYLLGCSCLNPASKGGRRAPRSDDADSGRKHSVPAPFGRRSTDGRFHRHVVIPGNAAVSGKRSPAAASRPTVRSGSRSLAQVLAWRDVDAVDFWHALSCRSCAHARAPGSQRVGQAGVVFLSRVPGTTKQGRSLSNGRASAQGRLTQPGLCCNGPRANGHSRCIRRDVRNRPPVAKDRSFSCQSAIPGGAGGAGVKTRPNRRTRYNGAAAVGRSL